MHITRTRCALGVQDDTFVHVRHIESGGMGTVDMVEILEWNEGIQEPSEDFSILELPTFRVKDRIATKRVIGTVFTDDVDVQGRPVPQSVQLLHQGIAQSNWVNQQTGERLIEDISNIFTQDLRDSSTQKRITEVILHSVSARYAEVSAYVQTVCSENADNGIRAALLAKKFGNIAPLHMNHKNGTAMVAMEYVEGCTAREVLSFIPEVCKEEEYSDIDIQEVYRVLGYHMLLNAAAIERAGVLHRDVKLGNFMVQPNGTVRSIDFGLAIMMRDADAENHIVGGSRIMPPEMFVYSENQKKKDVYGLACSLSALTGTKKQYPLQQVLPGLAALRNRDVVRVITRTTT